ncbi:MAG: hypothetical protein Q7S64_01890 [bacterium]|nr:hypothetical protein [bacterium]
MMSTLTSLWHPNFLRSLLVGLLVLVMFFSLVTFFRNEHYLIISALLLVVLLVGTVQYWKIYDGSLLAVVASFLLAYSATFILFSTPISVYTTALAFITGIGLVYYLLLAPPISLIEVGVLLFITVAAFLTTLYLPTNLFNIALLTTLPVMLATPVLIKKTLPLPSLALHVTITGLLGASLICLTAVLFI